MPGTWRLRVDAERVEGRHVLSRHDKVMGGRLGEGAARAVVDEILEAHAVIVQQLELVVHAERTVRLPLLPPLGVSDLRAWLIASIFVCLHANMPTGHASGDWAVITSPGLGRR